MSFVTELIIKSLSQDCASVWQKFLLNISTCDRNKFLIGQGKCFLRDTLVKQFCFLNKATKAKQWETITKKRGEVKARKSKLRD